MADYNFDSFDHGVAQHLSSQNAVPNQYDMSHFDNAMNAATPAQPPGMLESLARGAEQGVTMDFGSRLNALIKSQAGQGDYNKLLQQEQDRMELARAQHPYMYGAGNVAGFAVPTALTGGENLLGEAGIAGAAKAGATYGAISGVGNAKDLTNIPDVLSQVASGAASGALGGATLGAASEVATPILRQAGNLAKGAYGAISHAGPFPITMESFQQGLAGNNLWGEQPHIQATRDLIGRVNGASSTIQEALNNAAQEQRGALSNEDSSVDLSDWYKNALRGAINGKRFTSFQNNRDAIDQVMSVIDEFVHGDPDSAIPGRGLNPTPLQANELKRQLGLLGSEGEDALSNPVGRQFANRLISPLRHNPNEVEASFGLPDDFSPLKEEISSTVEGLSPANQRINKLLLAQDMLPDIRTLANAEKPTAVGAQASDRLQEFFNTLPNDVREQVQPSLESAAKSKYVADRINAGGLNRGALNLAETGRGMLWGGANWAGAAASGVGQAAQKAGSELASGNVGALFKTMYNQSPETFSTMGTKLSQMGGTAADIGRALLSAANKDQYGRNAIIFALTQNPSYRDKVEQLFGNGLGIDMKGPASAASQKENFNE